MHTAIRVPLLLISIDIWFQAAEEILILFDCCIFLYMSRIRGHYLTGLQVGDNPCSILSVSETSIVCIALDGPDGSAHKVQVLSKHESTAWEAVDQCGGEGGCNLSYSTESTPVVSTMTHDNAAGTINWEGSGFGTSADVHQILIKEIPGAHYVLRKATAAHSNALALLFCKSPLNLSSMPAEKIK